MIGEIFTIDSTNEYLYHYWYDEDIFNPYIRRFHLTSGELEIAWSLRIDTLTAVMLVVVTTVSSLVHLYSIGYMHEDPGY